MKVYFTELLLKIKYAGQPLPAVCSIEPLFAIMFVISNSCMEILYSLLAQNLLHTNRFIIKNVSLKLDILTSVAELSVLELTSSQHIADHFSEDSLPSINCTGH